MRTLTEAIMSSYSDTFANLEKGLIFPLSWSHEDVKNYVLSQIPENSYKDVEVVDVNIIVPFIQNILLHPKEVSEGTPGAIKATKITLSKSPIKTIGEMGICLLNAVGQSGEEFKKTYKDSETIVKNGSHDTIRCTIVQRDIVIDKNTPTQSVSQTTADKINQSFKDLYNTSKKIHIYAWPAEEEKKEMRPKGYARVTFDDHLAFDISHKVANGVNKVMRAVTQIFTWKFKK